MINALRLSTLTSIIKPSDPAEVYHKMGFRSLL